jgi:hypothetical protein
MLDNYQDLIDELLQAPATVRGVLSAVGPDSASPEALALISVLLQRDRVMLDRLQRLMREQLPHLKTLPSFDDAVSAAEPPSDLDQDLEAFDTARGDIISLLMNLTLRDWERTATHDEEGEITLAEEVERHVEFDEALRARLVALSAGA